MAINKLPTLALESNAITADLIASGAITAADISDGEITAAKLHTTLDFSAKTFTMANAHVTQAMVTQHQAALSVTESQVSDLQSYVLPNTSPTFTNTTLTGYLAGPATFTIDPAAVGDNTGTVVIAGNLQVDGTTTTINSTTLEVEDKNVVLGPNAANDAANNGAGLTVTQPDTSDATLIYDTTSTQWEFNKDLDVTGIVTATEINLDATGDIHSTVDTGYVGIAGGTNSNVGANALFYGGTHATLAGVTKFRSGSTGTVTILANGNVGLGYDSPSDNIHILGSNASPNVGITLQSDDTANATAAISLFARNASNINITNEIKNVAGQLFIERSDAGTDVLALKSTAAGAGGPQLDFYHHSASPAAGDTVGRINFNGYDDGSNATTYARIDGVANDVTNGTEKGHLVFSNRVDGSTFSEALRIDDEAGVFTGGQITGRGGGATSHLFHIDGTGKYYFELQQSDTSGNTDILFSDGTGGDYGIIGYEHANDRMQFYTKSSRRMVIDEYGNVGIANESAPYLLWPNASTGGLFLQAGGLLSAYNAGTNLSQNWYYNAGEKFIGNGGASRYVQSGQEHIWARSTTVNASGAGAALTWSESVRIDENGNVGIGTNNPAAPLEVHHATTPLVKIKATTSSGQAALYLDGYSDGGSTQRASRINFRKNTTTEWSIINDYDQSDSNKLDFEYAGSRKITFAGDGNVGIGTSSPSKKLHVSTTGTYDGILLSNGHAQSAARLQLNNDDSKSLQIDVGGSTQSTYGPYIANNVAIVANSAPLNIGTDSANHVAFYTALNERMRIDASGRVTMPYQPAASFKSSTGTTNTQRFGAVSVGLNNGNNLDTGSNSGRFNCPVTGMYRVTINTSTAYNGHYGWIGIRKNGTLQLDHIHWNKGGTGMHVNPSIQLIIQCSSGDYLEGWYINANSVAQDKIDMAMITMELIG